MIQRSRRWYLVPIALLCPLLLLASCGQQAFPAAGAGLPGALEAALLTGHWEGVDAAASVWMESPHWRHQGSIVRGYAAFARGDAAAASGHFLRAQSGKYSRQDAEWGNSLLVRYPQRAVAHLIAGDSQARRGDWHGALARLDTALDLEPDLAIARLACGVLRALTETRPAALDDLNALVTGGPVRTEALVARALIWLEAGQLEHAMANLNQALTLSPAHAVAYNTQGILHARHGAWDAAAQDFATAFRLLPELGAARQNWQLAQGARERGTVITGHGSIESLTIVVADPDKMRTMTASASEMIQGRTAQSPMIVTSPQEALSQVGSHHVILQVPTQGLDTVTGDRVFNALKTLDNSAVGNKIPVNIVAHGFEGAESSTRGIGHYLDTTLATHRAQINSVQLVDPSEVRGTGPASAMARSSTSPEP